MSRTTRATPNVFRIDAGLSFVDALAAGIIRRHGGDGGAGLGRVTVLLPTRRAVKSLREAFLRQSGGAPLILPVMRPVGDVEEDELVFSPAVAEADLALPPAAPPLWRHLTLTRLVEAFSKRHADSAGSTAQAVELAAALARFLDEVAIEGRDFADLAAVVPENFASHWQETLTFLQIVTRDWPAIVAGAGFMDAADRRNRLLRALAALWTAAPPTDPVIAAGSTGSIPATADLIAAVARLPQGAVVLPAFDRDMDDASWEALGPTHPQATMKKLIEDDIGIVRHEVADWLDAAAVASLPQSLAEGPPARRHLLREALRPAATTAAWRDAEINATAALEGLSRIDAPSPREEAGAIALLMREALETPERRAALVTPDRGLARRVAAELKRWGILVDDSAGQPLAETMPGVFLLLVAEMAGQAFAPVPLLAALKHPLAAGGLATAPFRAHVRELETAVLRGPRPPGGSDGIARALRALEDEATRDRLHPWWVALAELARPFADLVATGGSLGDLAAAHLRFAEALAASDDRAGPDRLWVAEAGEAAAAFFEELLDGGSDFAIAGGDYPAVLKALMAGRAVRPRYGRHPRLQIWGPLEARLQHVDLVILGGLNEGVWPPDAGVDPWLSRPMRAAFGLPPLERRVGLSAHDFYVAASAPAVVLTRAEKTDGAPTVPSRWLMRLDAVLRDVRIPAHPALDWFSALDRPQAVTPALPPEPRPPVDVRPKRLSVTEIGTWMRDPYAIYARRILRLDPLDPLDADPGAADKGIIIHAALDRFLKAHPLDLPPDAFDRLVAIGREEFGRHLLQPTVRAFWWPRFLHVAEWFIAHERERRPLFTTVLSEGRGDYILDGPHDFRLVAKADRIDRGPGGTLTIIDYKTGQAPEAREIAAGYQPQLPLEAVMAEAGAFKGLAAAAVAGLEFWRLHGGEPPVDLKAVKEVEARKDQAARGLRELVALFARPETPYRSAMRPDEVTAGDYDHLARIKEWSGVGSLAGRDSKTGEGEA